MLEQPVVFIVSLFLVLITIQLTRYLSRSSSFSAQAFLFASAVVFLLAIVFTVFLGTHRIILATALALGITLSLVHPVAAICFFVSNLFLRPWEASSSNLLLTSMPRLLALVTLISWLAYILRNKADGLVWNLPCSLYACFLFWLLVSSWFAPFSDSSLKFYFDNFFPITVLSLLIVNTLKRPMDIEMFSKTLLLSVVGVVCVAIYITWRDFAAVREDYRLHGVGLWGNANDLAALAVCVLPFALTTLLSKRNYRSFSAINWPASLAFILGIVWSQSRGALISLLVGVIFYFAFCVRTKKTVALTLLAVGFLAILLHYAILLRTYEDLSVSNLSRTSYLVAGINMAKHYPIFGVGLGNYPRFYEQYTPSFFEWGNRTAHSSWVLVLAETGIIGFLLFVGLFLSTLSYAWRLRKKHPQFFLAMVTYGTAMSFLSHTYLFLPYILMAVVLASARTLAISPAVASKTGNFQTSTENLESRGGYRRRWRPRIYGSNAPLATMAAGLLISLGYCTEVRANEVSDLKAVAGIDKPLGAYNPIFTDNLTLKGSRGETLTFLIFLAGKGCSKVTYDFDNIKQGSVTFALYSLPPLKTTHPSFPGAFVGEQFDPTVPLEDEISCLDSKVRIFFGEFKLSSNLLPGEFHGRIQAGQRSLPLKLVVWRMVMPDKPALPAYSEITPLFVMLGHFGRWSENDMELVHEYVREMYAHRVAPIKSAGEPLEVKADQKLDIYTTPSVISSFNSTVLYQRPAWAYFDFPTMGASGFQKIDFERSARYFEAIERTIPEIGRPGKALVYLWDEPKPEIWPELIKLSAQARAKAPSLKQLVTTTYNSALAQSVDIFAPVMDVFDRVGHPRLSAYRLWQEQGKEVWWYVSCMSHGCDALVDSGVPDLVVDRPAAYVRSIGWLSMKYKLDGFLYYSAVNGYQYYPERDPWDSLWDFSGNGDGTLYYPGRPTSFGIKKHTPIASLRLKLWRESSYDAEYIRWMEGLPNKPKWWIEEFKSLVPSTTAWSRNYQAYSNLRDKAGQYLNDI